MNKAKIAFVIPSLRSGGAERVVSTLSNTLSNQYEVHIICLVRTIPFYKIQKGVTIHYCLEENNNSTGIVSAVANNLKLVRKLITIIKQNGIQILLGFITSANILSIISGKLCGIPVIISERNNPKNDRIPSMWKKLRDLFYPYANWLVVQTEDTKKFYQEKLNIKRQTVIANPISTDFKVDMDTASNQSSKENIILNVGRLHPQKAQDVLIKAFSKTNYTDWQLYLVGEGERRKDLENLISTLNLQKKVHLVGRVEEIQKVYDRAKIFAFSSIYEGFPNALIEAMHFGLACVSTNCPTGPSELIENGENGYLIDVNDTSALTKKLNILMESEELRISFGQKAQEKVAKFNAENIAQEWSHKINHCLNIQ
ncbi:glycosyltransferase family 4 protein [Flagellimonas profundi]|uniref:Glycosyltransferase family 4 protein n=1 Tax=Flagellimonas profundi TaxID=2915620 RepID=A0ABS3FBJ8_9FLAO|nr:glycosyltransferase family 4 protein [Allomuricauda profundi]MBO0340532.1 glycosyltransferase family 4 protein [Allomuricauda profundi]